MPALLRSGSIAFARTLRFETLETRHCLSAAADAYFLAPIAGGIPATDSASAATALATGSKTDNGNISWQTGDPSGGQLQTIAEKLRAERGFSVGVVSTVPISHATPAAMVSHNTSRGNTTAIASEIINTTQPEVVIGSGYPNDGQFSYIAQADYNKLLAGRPDTPGLYAPASSTFYLRDSATTGGADKAFGFGAAGAGWLPLAGDWNADGRVTIGLYNPATSLFYLRNSITAGMADVTVGFGPAGRGWLPVVGDWNGDGVTTIGLYDPASSHFYLRNSHTSGFADVAFGFGAAGAGWLPVAGDWNGDGVDSVGLYNPTASMFFLRNSNTTGAADIAFGFGAPRGWKPVTGDWNHDGSDSVGLYDPAASLFYQRNGLSTGIAEQTFGFGARAAGWLPIAGAWNGGYTFVERTAGTDGGAALLAAAASVNPNAGEKLFGLFGSSSGSFDIPQPSDTPGIPNIVRGSAENPSLPQAAQAALRVLSRDNQGFFAMIEEGDIDWSNHANNFKEMIGGVWELDQTVRAVTNFVDQSGDNVDWSNTLVIVTADHSNGYMRLVQNLGAGNLPTQVSASGWTYPNGDVTYQTTGHTNELVTLQARGAGANLFAGKAGTLYPGTQIVDNTQVYQVIAAAAAAGTRNIVLVIGDGMPLEDEVAASRYLYGQDSGLAWHNWGTLADGWAGYAATWDVTTYNKYADAAGRPHFDPAKPIAAGNAAANDPLLGYSPALGGTAPHPRG